MENFILTNGIRIRLRAIQKEDLELWLSFVSKLSNRTKYLRFHSLPKLTRQDAEEFCTIDHINSYAYIALLSDDTEDRIIAIGRYNRIGSGNIAEVAIVIDDSYWGLGIGGRLMKTLVKVARGNGIEIFEADILAENTGVIKMLKHHGFHFKSRLESGVYHLQFFIN